jgi:hypothetical protein
VAVDLTVPGWLTEKTAKWIDRLSMREWNVAIGLALAPGNDPDCRALTEQYADINFGRITFRADAEDTNEWEIYLVHELLHIKHSRTDDVVERVIRPHLDGVASEMADSAYRRAVEPFIHSLAVSLVELRTNDQPG